LELKVFYTIFIFIFGLLFGSFYNVVGWRIPKKLSIVRPGSFCPKCKHKLKWYELIPVFSYLIQGGKCRACKAKIAPFYTVTELLTGFLFAASFWLLGFSFEFLLAIITASFFSIVLVSDINFLIIPDQFTLFFSIFVVILRFMFNGVEDALFSLAYGIGAFLVMYLLMLIGNLILRKESLGGGDIKLMFFVGIAVGPWMSIFTIFLSSFIAFPLSLILFLKSRDNIIPYGPFLLIACFLVIAFQINIDMIINI
jgi:leader peptidase (prepilin peptidase)/N-methyltransferase